MAYNLAGAMHAQERQHALSCCELAVAHAWRSMRRQSKPTGHNEYGCLSDSAEQTWQHGVTPHACAAGKRSARFATMLMASA